MPPVSAASAETFISEPRRGGDEAYCPSCERSFPIIYNICPDDGTRLAKLVARTDDMIGRVFDGRYEVRAALGAGGMGTVYRANQLAVDRDVALKVIHPSLATDRTAVKRFLREARLITRLGQANIVNVYDFGQDTDGTLYLVMELLRGKTLADVLDAGPMPTKRVVGIALQLCDALHAAHAEGIVHRDLKPGNIVVLDDPPGREHIKVLDFGLAKSLVGATSSSVTMSNAIVGTPLYMAPEQVECKPGDHRTDLYALGCILYHMIAGAPMFLSDSPNLVLAAHLSETPPPLPLDANADLVALVEALLAKSPDARPPTALAVRAQLEHITEAPTRELPSRPSIAPTQRRPSVVPVSAAAPAPAPRRRWLFALVPVVALGVAAIAYRVAWYSAARTPPDGANVAAAPPPVSSATSTAPDAASMAAAPVIAPDATVLTVEAIEPDAPPVSDAGIADDAAAASDAAVVEPPRSNKTVPKKHKRKLERSRPAKPVKPAKPAKPAIDPPPPVDVDFIEPAP